MGGTDRRSDQKVGARHDPRPSDTDKRQQGAAASAPAKALTPMEKMRLRVQQKLSRALQADKKEEARKRADMRYGR